MKKTIRIVCLVMAVLILLAVPVSAEERNTYSSIFFGSYDSAIYVSGRTLEICFDVVGVNVFTLFNIRNGVTDLLTVFYNIFAAFYVANCVFVAVFNIYFNIVKFIY